jgi:hypothetical protein
MKVLVDVQVLGHGYGDAHSYSHRRVEIHGYRHNETRGHGGTRVLAQV